MKSVIQIGKRSGWENAYIDLPMKKEGSGARKSGIKYSQFNAELCETIVRNWSKPNDTIVDPFGGWGTRAVVTSTLGRNYIGYEISPTTHKLVTNHIHKLGLDAQFILGDGTQMIHTPNQSVDTIISCPPYHTLEYYEITPNQLTDIPKYTDFMIKIGETCSNIHRVLKPNGWVCWVVGDFRGEHKWGGFINYHGDTITEFKRAGLTHWDTIILHNPSPLTPIVESNSSKRWYSAKEHEYLLIFNKGGNPPIREGINTKWW